MAKIAMRHSDLNQAFPWRCDYNKVAAMTELIDILWEGAQSGEITAELPELEIDEGQRLQLELLDKWQATGEQLAGYKVGLTSGAARNAFGPGVRPFGFILMSRVLQSGGSLGLTRNLGVENELVFRVCKSIKATGVTAEHAREIVDGVAPGFEVNQHRLKQPGSNGIRIADNLSQWGIVVGDFQKVDRPYEQLSVQLKKDGEIQQEVAAAGHIDNHFESIAALINRLHRFDRCLQAGELVITGSFTRAAVSEPGIWSGDFADLGQVTLEVTA
jgi:2-keto-4-pentenoate hydratase